MKGRGQAEQEERVKSGQRVGEERVTCFAVCIQIYVYVYVYVCVYV